MGVLESLGFAVRSGAWSFGLSPQLRQNQSQTSPVKVLRLQAEAASYGAGF
jgi:hypothetical protein